MSHAYREVFGNVGYEIDHVTKGKSLLKFGSRTLATAGTKYTLWNAPDANETLLTTNAITTMVSTSAADLETVYVEYHTISGANLTFGLQGISLFGQTPVTLAVPCARVSRIYNASATELAGTVSAYEGGAAPGGVPTTTAEVHAQIKAGEQQTEKAATSISSTDVFLISHLNVALLRTSGTPNVDVTLEVKNYSGVWRPKMHTGISASGTSSAVIEIDPYIVVYPNSEVRITAISDTNTTPMVGWFSGFLATALR